MPAPASKVKITRVSFNGSGKAHAENKPDDQLAVETPLEISIIYGNGGSRRTASISVTMCTPGNEKELAAGFLFTEGIIRDPDEIAAIGSPKISREDNRISVELREEVAIDLQKLQRHFYTSSSCGVCGKASIGALKQQTERIGSESVMAEAAILQQLPAQLRAKQEIFEHTGGLHASALFDTKGGLISLKEDVGRHNALDKLIGEAFLQNRLPLNGYLLLLSGRASFELIQKAAMAGIPVVCAVGAPSSLAVETAEAANITLVGFLRENRFNIYSHPERIKI